MCTTPTRTRDTDHLCVYFLVPRVLFTCLLFTCLLFTYMFLACCLHACCLYACSMLIYILVVYMLVPCLLFTSLFTCLFLACCLHACSLMLFTCCCLHTCCAGFHSDPTEGCFHYPLVEKFLMTKRRSRTLLLRYLACRGLTLVTLACACVYLGVYLRLAPVTDVFNCSLRVGVLMSDPSVPELVMCKLIAVGVFSLLRYESRGQRVQGSKGPPTASGSGYGPAPGPPSQLWIRPC